jgi:hemolysin III
METQQRPPADPRDATAVAVPHESLLERVASAVTHGAGTGLSIAGLVMLIIAAAWTGSAWAVLSVVVYGTSLIFLFLSSTLYHSLSHNRRVGELLEAFDHVGIFLLIAGTYTPFTLIALPGWQGWFLFGAIWALAIGGIVMRLVWVRYLHPVFIVIYVIMGWLGVMFGGPIGDRIGPQGINLLLIGGIFYTVGLIFFVWRRLPFNHMVWHLFVLAGAVFHFFAIFYYVVPTATF